MLAASALASLVLAGAYFGTELDAGVRYRMLLHGSELTVGLQAGVLLFGSALEGDGGATDPLVAGRFMLDYQL